MIGKWVAILCLAITSIVMIGCDDRHHNPDDVMVENFHQHKEDFEALMKLATSDPELIEYLKKYPTPKVADDSETTGTLKQQLTIYRRLLRNCGVTRVHEYNSTDEYPSFRGVHFDATATGYSFGGAYKSYVYCDPPPDSKYIVPSIDEYTSPNHESYQIYRHIEGNWYLWYYFDD